MTKTAIMKLINDVNLIKDIKWSILKNTKNEIILTNDYDKSISFTILVKYDDLDEWIEVIDNHMGYRVVLLIWDEDNWGDYTETEQGIALAIERTVDYFNSTY